MRRGGLDMFVIFETEWIEKEGIHQAQLQGKKGACVLITMSSAT